MIDRRCCGRSRSISRQAGASSSIPVTRTSRHGSAGTRPSRNGASSIRLVPVSAWNDVAIDPQTGVVTYETFYEVVADGSTYSSSSQIAFPSKERIEKLIDHTGLVVLIDGDWVGGPHPIGETLGVMHVRSRLGGSVRGIGRHGFSPRLWYRGVKRGRRNQCHKKTTSGRAQTPTQASPATRSLRSPSPSLRRRDRPFGSRSGDRRGRHGQAKPHDAVPSMPV